MLSDIFVPELVPSVAALDGAAEFVFEFDSYSFQSVVVWPAPESLGCHAAHAKSDVGE
jgi:hypothetical protein